MTGLGDPRAVRRRLPAEVVSLAGGMPNLTALPLDVVGKLTGEPGRRRGASALQYGSGQGDPLLRELICEVMALEGVVASPEDVVVTVGSQQALDLVTRVFVDPGDVVLAEAPSYVGALGTVRRLPGRRRPRGDGRRRPGARGAARGDRRRRALRPAGQVPLHGAELPQPAGVSMAESRRDEVLAICSAAGLLVLEDNPYGLLGFDAPPTRAIRRRESGRRRRRALPRLVLQDLRPGLRTGWVLAPHAVREKLVLAAEASVLCPPRSRR
jgi:DNA-binding transcriptional MocR family regulator